MDNLRFNLSKDQSHPCFPHPTIFSSSVPCSDCLSWKLWSQWFLYSFTHLLTHTSNILWASTLPGTVLDAGLWQETRESHLLSQHSVRWGDRHWTKDHTRNWWVKTGMGYGERSPETIASWCILPPHPLLQLLMSWFRASRFWICV